MKIVDVVIVNWNTGGHLQVCLAALASSRRDGFRFGTVIVVDNASTDGSTEGLSAFGGCTLLRNDANRGFGFACNQGAARGNGDFILFLNPDVIVDVDAVDCAVAALQHPDAVSVGICGAQLRDAHGKVQRSCARFPTPWSMAGQIVGLDRLVPSLVPPHFMREWPHDSSRRVDQVMGAFFLVRRTVFTELGGFDERYFVYYEDLDFSLRAARRGWASLFTVSATAVHVGGGSSGSVPARRLFYVLRSRTLYISRHFGMPTLVYLLITSLVVEPVVRAIHRLVTRRGRGFMEILYAYALFVRWLVESTAGLRATREICP